jgi:hypothetical protein
LVRLADVILWRAECAAEADDLPAALADVNLIRNRAANTAGFVREGNLPAGAPAANYDIEPYTSFSTKEAALTAIRIERKLELAMEGHRYFDLVRWGIAEQVMNDYLEVEGTKRVEALGNTSFKSYNVRMPIPEDAINRSVKDGVPTLTQNTGY